MKKAGLCLAGLFLITINGVFTQEIGTLDGVIEQASKYVEGNLKPGTKLAILNFASSSEEFSTYVVDEVTGFLVRGKKVTIVDRRNLALIRKEMDLQLSGDVSDESAQAIGRQLGAQAIVSGSLTNLGNRYRFKIQVINVETAAIEAQNSYNLQNDEQTAFLLTGNQSSAPPVAQTPQTGTGGTTPQSRTQTAPAVPQNMVRILGGTFKMGSPASEPERHDNEGPQHQVTVSSFYMGKYEVTQKEYQEVMGKKPSYFKGDNLPVESVSWYDAVEYCNARSVKEGLTPAYRIDKSRSDPNNQSSSDTVRWAVTWDRNANGYRLPTEAEWEYACRGGTTTPFSTGNNITTGLANYNGNYNNPKGIYRKKTTEVGSFAPNPWGLYDMHGNVAEWCWDWYGAYSADSQTDPAGASSGSSRGYHGGSWRYVGWVLRSAIRNYGTPSDGFNYLGFRVLRP